MKKAIIGWKDFSLGMKTQPTLQGGLTIYKGKILMVGPSGSINLPWVSV